MKLDPRPAPPAAWIQPPQAQQLDGISGSRVGVEPNWIQLKGSNSKSEDLSPAHSQQAKEIMSDDSVASPMSQRDGGDDLGVEEAQGRVVKRPQQLWKSPRKLADWRKKRDEASSQPRGSDGMPDT